jgi:hypothetical protein
MRFRAGLPVNQDHGQPPEPRDRTPMPPECGFLSNKPIGSLSDDKAFRPRGAGIRSGESTGKAEQVSYRQFTVGRPAVRS